MRSSQAQPEGRADATRASTRSRNRVDSVCPIMSRFLRSFLVLSTSLKRSGERERDSRTRQPARARQVRALRRRPCRGVSVTFGYEGKSSHHDNQDEPTAPNDDLEVRIARVGASWLMRSVYFIAPSQPTGVPTEKPASGSAGAPEHRRAGRVAIRRQ